MNIKQRIHDGRTFFWTSEVIKSGEEIVGFYFDDLGFPQTIKRKSIYGDYIIKWDSSA